MTYQTDEKPEEPFVPSYCASPSACVEDEPYGWENRENYAELSPENFGPDPDWRWSRTCDGEPVRWHPMLEPDA